MYTDTEPIPADVEVKRSPGGMVNYRSDCDECVRGKGKGGPSHEALQSCRSGRRPHCTCDGCY